MDIRLIYHPIDDDWREVKRRALITMYGKGLKYVKIPDSEWRHKIRFWKRDTARFDFCDIAFFLRIFYQMSRCIFAGTFTRSRMPAVSGMTGRMLWTGI